jgi:starvation-inducible DNA-binding protein
MRIYWRLLNPETAVAISTLMTPLDKQTRRSALVNQRLAEVVDLLMQVKQACWNVKRSQSTSLHELFEEIAREVEFFTDIVAERIVQLGGIAKGTVRTAAVHSRLEEYPLVAGSRSHVEAVAKALSDFGRQARTAVREALALGDADTADLFTEICRGVDKWLGFVRTRSNTFQYQRHKQEFALANALERRLVNHDSIRLKKMDPASGLHFLTKFRQKNRTLRKEIICQSSTASTPRTARP